MSNPLRRSVITIAVSTVFLAVICLQAAHAEGCKIRNFSGAYGVTINGYISFSTATPPLLIGKFSPISVSGTVTFGTSGKVSRSVQGNVGGVVFPVVDSGSYVRNSDCTFTITHGNGEVWTATPVRHSEEIEFSVTSLPGAVGVGAGTMVLKDSE
jgi:hypothetical protein